MMSGRVAPPGPYLVTVAFRALKKYSRVYYLSETGESKMFVRPMQAQGFYRGDVRSMVAAFDGELEMPAQTGVITAALVPHAGWGYSGPTAHQVYRAIERANGQVGTFVLLGAVHVWGVERVAIFPGGAWDTPEGRVEVDESLAESVFSRTSGYSELRAGAHDREHSIEVQLPFIKVMFPRAKILPIMVPVSRDAAGFGDDLAAVLAECSPQEVVVLGSTDLTHYGPHFDFMPAGGGEQGHRWMKANDQSIIDRCLAMDAASIIDEVVTRHNACGGGAITATVAYAGRRGVAQGRLLNYITSHDRIPEGRFQMGVGYAGIVY